MCRGCKKTAQTNPDSRSVEEILLLIFQFESWNKNRHQGWSTGFGAELSFEISSATNTPYICFLVYVLHALSIRQLVQLCWRQEVRYTNAHYCQRVCKQIISSRITLTILFIPHWSLTRWHIFLKTMCCHACGRYPLLLEYNRIDKCESQWV